MKKVFLDDLPKKLGNGRSKGKFVIDWRKSIGWNVTFIYNAIQGEIKIIDYSKNYLYIRYLDKDIFKISSTHFCDCRLGNYLGEFTKNFKFEIGTHFIDNNRNMIVTDREYRTKTLTNGKKQTLKWYKYICNKCGYDSGWINESSLKKGTGCSACCSTPRVAIQGINDIPTTAPWMVKYFQGGYDEAKQYIKNSEQRIQPICPECGTVKNKTLRIQDIYIQHSIGCACGDGYSYPEKFIYNLLKQLNNDFIIHANNKTLNWCNNFIYDFYIPSLNCIIETHGIQHYKETFAGLGGRTLDIEQKNDKLKEQLAKENGIRNYIIIDCRCSDMNYIKNNILNSNLFALLNKNESDIDWVDLEECNLKSLVKIACKYKQDNPDMTTVDIGKILGISSATVSNYLKKGNKLSWCVYDIETENKKRNIKGAKNSAKKNGKQVEILKDGVSLGIFQSCHELQRQSEKLFNLKLLQSNISEVCRGRCLTYKGFTFKYVSI